MRIQKSTDKEDFGRKGLFRADSLFDTWINPFYTDNLHNTSGYGLFFGLMLNILRSCTFVPTSDEHPLIHNNNPWSPSRCFYWC
ncbi:MAG: hypothetical protein JJU02_10145 [Cryomorphaceae bacterium]|nr:hypothetical protein [Cryomorphaceae bacterium]